jgi:hypothetical protein
MNRRAPVDFLSLRMSDGQLVLIVLGLRGPFRPGLCDGLRVADRLGQHEAQLILGHRWLPCGRCFPLCHTYLYGVPERELKPGTKLRELRSAAKIDAK